VGPTLEVGEEPSIIGSTAGAPVGAVEAPPEPSRKRKQRFSSLK
jgi:hypothetical protein